ncbi:MAG: SDR family NAD(P)-dependent oxidoreductase, partial [Clostridia bacterium]|nr:SDR family NAD(P)-dependent oxidoreductase [Clostridia bacterium]
MKLKNKTVIVTASTRGIGRAITEVCAKEGATVYMAARNLERAQEEAARLNREGFNVKCVYNDASVPESYSSMAETVAKNEGRIDVLVNNFGASDPKKDLDLA